MTAPTSLVLFDVDMTLIYTGRAGANAFSQAWEAMGTGLTYPRHVDFVGRTDPAIVAEIARTAGLGTVDESFLRAFETAYLERLPLLLQAGEDAGGRVLPGVHELLRALDQRGVRTALVTGNWIHGAWLKLQHYGLLDYFCLGAYGSDHGDRNRLPPLARLRAQRLWEEDFPPERVFVVGDSVRDVACARANGYRAVAVATGMHTAIDLKNAGAGVVIPNLLDTRALVEMFVPVQEGGTRGRTF